MTLTVGAFEAKTKLSKLLDRVEGGETITVTRRGKAVAKLVPVAPENDNKIDVDEVKRIARKFVQSFGRPFKSTDIGDLLYDEDGLPK